VKLQTRAAAYRCEHWILNPIYSGAILGCNWLGCSWVYGQWTTVPSSRNKSKRTNCKSI